jgi:hypothetical protein
MKQLEQHDRLLLQERQPQQQQLLSHEEDPGRGGVRGGIALNLSLALSEGEERRIHEESERWALRRPLSVPGSISARTTSAVGDGETDRASDAIEPQNSIQSATASPGTFSLESNRPNARGQLRLRRAKTWSLEVENSYRLQQGGWRHIHEYRNFIGEVPSQWPNGLFKKVELKNGNKHYWKCGRECADKDLAKVKIFYFE